jgi:outer membrane usher protein
MAIHAALFVTNLNAQTMTGQSIGSEQAAFINVASTPPMYLRYIDVTLNLAPVGQWMLLDNEGELFATPEILQQWRLIVPAGGRTIDFRGGAWVPLHALPGYRARFDFGNQSLELEFSPEAFVTTQMKPSMGGPLVLTKTTPAVFLNYDLAHTLSAGNGVATQRNTGALTEVGLALGVGTLISSQVSRNLGSTDPKLQSESVRLETTWTKDFQDKNLTLRVGDTATRASLWGRNMFFGGLQIGKNFGLTPGFFSQPLPILSGSASSPGTVELYVNNALRQISNVPAGPFTVENFTQITGAGEARVVVRDLLGRESVIVSPFFTSTQLLEKGLTDWSLNIGKERYNLGISSHDYRDSFSSGLFRQGVTKSLTLEGRAEWSKNLQTAGVGASTQIPGLGLGQAALAMSRDATDRTGKRLLLGFDRQDTRNGFSARVVHATRDYRELGFGPTELPYRSEQALNVRHTLDNKASLGMSMARLENYDQGASKVMTGSYTMRVFERGSLIMSATRVSGSQSGFSVGVSLLLSQGGKGVTTASVTHTRQGSEAYAAFTEPVGNESGVGWRVLAGHRVNEDHAETGLYYQGGRGFLGADLATSGQTQNLRLNAQGAAVYMEGHFFASRRLQESFALVHVPGYPNVGVGFQGESITQTDASGFAMLPRLAAYQTNTIRLNANDLPMSTELDNIEATAVPSWRSGVSIQFPVRSGQGALVKIITPEGEPVPAGATVELVGDGKAFFVARRGEVFLTGLQKKNTALLKWEEHACKAQIDLPPVPDDQLIRIGPILCMKVPK